MEIALRAAIIFVFLWVVTRAVGRTTLAILEADGRVSFFTRDSSSSSGAPEPPPIG